MRHRPFLLAGSCILTLAACGPSRPPEPDMYSPNYRPPREEIFNGGPNAILLKYDANHDGELTRAELAAGLKAEFASYDAGHKGCINVEQTAAINASRIAADQATATPLQDWNNDDCIDLREFSTTANSLFAERDRDLNGVITAKEFKPAGARDDEEPGREVRGERGPGQGRPGGGSGGGGPGGGPPRQ